MFAMVLQDDRPFRGTEEDEEDPWSIFAEKKSRKRGGSRSRRGGGERKEGAEGGGGMGGGMGYPPTAFSYGHSSVPPSLISGSFNDLSYDR